VEQETSTLLAVWSTISRWDLVDETLEATSVVSVTFCPACTPVAEANRPTGEMTKLALADVGE